jgi:general secretion pathway protein B
LVLLLVVTLFVSGWFVWHQYQPPAGSYQPPVTLAADRTRAVTNPPVEEEGVAEVVTANTVASAPPAQTRTPVESYQPPAESVSQTASVPQSPSRTEEEQETVDQTESTPATSSQELNARRNDSIPKSAANEKPVVAETDQFHPGIPEPISYWELPDAVRADIPEIKFSVLVYAADPADRFVLINGERLSEGDSAQPGLVVKEIRRDGVVFSYRLYQFLVER